MNKEVEQNEVLDSLFKQHKENALCGRYITSKHIIPLLKEHSKKFKIQVVGQSVLKESIHSITIGSGKKKILMWSQMHGNESTTTKAIFDLLNFFIDNQSADNILKECTLVIIPILNPDGATAYTRVNANAIDLNRDAQNLTQPESIVLNTVFNNFKPHYCFNLHGQRTIFSAGNSGNLASVSFLAPAQDIACTITDNRKIAMSIIVKMNTMLQVAIPNQVGIYDDTFNINCVGDTFQSYNVPTLLFEAGHCANDYEREEVRRLIFQSYVIAIKTIVHDQIDSKDYKDYLKMPQNRKLFFDIIIKNAKYKDEKRDIAIQYHEQLIDGKIHFIPKVEKIENLDAFYAHKYIDANDSAVFDANYTPVELGSENDFVLINKAKYSLLFI